MSVGKGLPKRVSRSGWKNRFIRYIAEKRREKNKARRIVKDAMKSKNPIEVAKEQSLHSPETLIFVEKLLAQKFN